MRLAAAVEEERNLLQAREDQRRRLDGKEYARQLALLSDPPADEVDENSEASAPVQGNGIGEPGPTIVNHSRPGPMLQLTRDDVVDPERFDEFTIASDDDDLFEGTPPHPGNTTGPNGQMPPLVLQMVNQALRSHPDPRIANARIDQSSVIVEGPFDGPPPGMLDALRHAGATEGPLVRFIENEEVRQLGAGLQYFPPDFPFDRARITRYLGVPEEPSPDDDGQGGTLIRAHTRSCRPGQHHYDGFQWR
jgi:hypothetical protein